MALLKRSDSQLRIDVKETFFTFDLSHGENTLENVNKTVEQYKQAFPNIKVTHVLLDRGRTWQDSGYLIIYIYRQETNQEYQKRMQHLEKKWLEKIRRSEAAKKGYAKRKAALEAKERKMLEKLKAKYENK